LRYGDFLPLFIDEDAYVFLRSTLGQRILVALNKSEKSRKIFFKLPEMYEISNALDLVTRKSLPVTDSQLRLNMGGMGWKILELKSHHLSESM
jgi:hypothetical protein